jgi:hypothetical protein
LFDQMAARSHLALRSLLASFRPGPGHRPGSFGCVDPTDRLFPRCA